MKTTPDVEMVRAVAAEAESRVPEGNRDRSVVMELRNPEPHV
jgi:hypothetical protein